MTLLTTETIADLTQEVWNALLAEDRGPLVPDEVMGEDVVAMATITGEWNGTVCVSCSRVAARHATSAMFGMEDAELTADEINDAVGELVNVVGGNIKSLVPGPSVLGLPTVVEGTPVRLPTHLQLTHEVRFSWMAEPVVVSVWTDPA
jgi:chemotaxis protein CheX